MGLVMCEMFLLFKCHHVHELYNPQTPPPPTVVTQTHTQAQTGFQHPNVWSVLPKHDFHSPMCQCPTPECPRPFLFPPPFLFSHLSSPDPTPSAREKGLVTIA